MLFMRSVSSSRLCCFDFDKAFLALANSKMQVRKFKVSPGKSGQTGLRFCFKEGFHASSQNVSSKSCGFVQ